MTEEDHFVAQQGDLNGRKDRLGEGAQVDTAADSPTTGESRATMSSLRGPRNGSRNLWSQTASSHSQFVEFCGDFNTCPIDEQPHTLIIARPSEMAPGSAALVWVF